MNRKLNKNESAILAKAIYQKRLSIGLTLAELENITGVNSSQISRFEAASFKFASKNLQKICNFLQVETLYKNPNTDLGERVEKFAGKSPLHRLAVEELLRAIEHIDSIKASD
ncbi:helix-turn-helix domain-containing protein [Marinobacter alexandrii]|uniref:helix-turn-helix domain-containing protein n=1 Tax=Marinobacter alexandrii TaxID=2570351 RepID=UPI001108FFD6|nr:helix-turn-helix transcriptional regulator [Marinobacter alexandrii]